MNTQIERRIVGLDGFRGVLTLMVILSHYFGEVPLGLPAAMYGWVAVGGFFVLSGFLIGRLILDRKDRANFFWVFYARRACRILPPYFLTVIVVSAILLTVQAPWRDANVELPLWSYLLFVQNFAMAAKDSMGAHWLAPTWTLAVEEHFYLAAPAILVFTPRRWLVPALLASCALALGMRIGVFYFGWLTRTAGHTLIFALSDTLALGILTSIAVRENWIKWDAWGKYIPLIPTVGLLAIVALKLWDQRLFEVARPTFLALAASGVILCVIGNLPIGNRMTSKTLQFFGNNGYCLYLTHLPVLGLMHGLILGTNPDLATPAQWAVTFAALPVCVLVGWGMTRLIEEPLTRYGRSFQWSRETRGQPVIAQTVET
ncbi:acyltransferase [Rhodoblastus sp.]|uniref:acyltransferase family protein n=1 Tax=Rhodoblastus sp. TaxID=1962975 RepID=UPI0025EE45A5|nr:acyltransferase [Rhodoblastus sp.]